MFPLMLNTLYDTVLPYVTSLDLGIAIAQDLSPSIHISEIAAKAHQRAKCILRTFVSKDINLLMRAFYCSHASDC